MIHKEHNIINQTFFLLPQKAIFWKEQKCLIVSDLHLGKSHHFRKGGVALPKQGDYENFIKLRKLIEFYLPEEVILLGDLFHSVANNHVLEAKEFFDKFQKIKFHLVMGNHDIMDSSWYNALKLIVHQESLIWPPFIFTHEPLEKKGLNDNLYNLAGHIHPGVRMRGKARQAVILPCFYFSNHQGILPSFGVFTGNYTIKPKQKDGVYVIVNEEIIEVN